MNITITPSALEYLQGLIAKQPEGTGVRLFVLQGGTPQSETCLAYRKPDEDISDHSLLEDTGELQFYVENASADYLEEAHIDYQTDRLGGQLTIKAPNAKMKKVDKNSPISDKVNYLLYTEINPALAAHGGFVSLETMAEDDSVAVLRFGGGCQGCGMVDVTLKHSVEKTLLDQLPELKAVRDSTDHSDRSNAYY